MSYAARNPALRLRLEGWRARLLLLLVAFALLGLSGRATYLQGMNHDFLQREGNARFSRVIELPANRGMVFDRHGEPLAISTPVESVWANPSAIHLSTTQGKKLAKLLGMNAADIERKLADKERSFVFLKRQISPALAADVQALDIKGIDLQREYRRYYPAGEVMAHLVGFTGIDDNGQEGMELALQDVLVGTPGAKRVIKDRAGRIVEDIESIRTPQDGKPVMLSIDSKLQYLAHRELKAGVYAHRASAGAIIVLDCTTGEILALASMPDYNPNNREKLKPTQIRNRPVTDIFEPGSTLKPFTVAAALEQGLVAPGTHIQTAPGRLTVGDRTIHDAHPQGMLTVSEIIQKSSNVGVAKIALSLSKQSMWDVFTKVGFGEQPNTGLPGEASGRLRPHRDWRPIEQATMSYGHGISVSLVQLARAYTVFATNGVARPLSIVKLEQPGEAAPVISENTARAMRAMLETVVKPGGTAPKAQVPGYTVAGKTGTAHKLINGGYAHNRYVSSFVGFAPASNPRVLIAVMIDEPSAGQYYGGAVAAPIFSKVMFETLRMLSVAPDAPLEQWSAPLDSAPEVKEEV
jgi:cell division protein FtsI (penicillin-binding protein 3)